MRHLLQIEGTPKETLEGIFAAARGHKQALAEGRLGKALEGKLVANLFFEDSTRTRSSFEVAATSLGC
jgi:aspartate carbamoyltransferase catalytic subunit